MTLPNDELQLAALSIIAGSEEPVGSLRLSQALSELGTEVAEATAGRYLNALQREGYVTASGPKRGRVITREGLDRVGKLTRRSRQLQRSMNLVEMSEIADIDDLIAVLQVRRGVESEGAALAAEHADTDTKQALLDEALKHVHTAEGGQIPTADDSSSFHLLIAQASGNSVLASVAQTLMDPANERRLRSGEDVSVARNVVAAQAKQHLEIATAIRAGEPARAAELMRAHLDGFIDAATGFRRNRTTDPSVVLSL